jgi:hypothetical protein
MLSTNYGNQELCFDLIRQEKNMNEKEVHRYQSKLEVKLTQFLIIGVLAHPCKGNPFPKTKRNACSMK